MKITNKFNINKYRNHEAADIRNNDFKFQTIKSNSLAKYLR